MDFGRLPTLEGVDLRLPPDAPATARVLARASSVEGPAGGAPSIRIGAPTFANRTWIGSYYPPGVKDAEMLRHYARLLPTLELNSTHYGLPDDATIARWRDQTGPGFRFCPKLPQRISHDFGLGPLADPEVRTFAKWLTRLGADRLGPAFLQLPPTFGPDLLPTLQRFLTFYKEVVPAHPLAVELRHPLWYASPLAREEVFGLLEALEMPAIITDVAGRRDVLHQRLTTPLAFIRFNGHHPDNSDYARLDEWAERLADWLRMGLQEIYFFVHEPEARQVPVMARYLAEQLTARTGLAIAAPAPVIRPVQGSLF